MDILDAVDNPFLPTNGLRDEGGLLFESSPCQEQGAVRKEDDDEDDDDDDMGPETDVDAVDEVDDVLVSPTSNGNNNSSGDHPTVEKMSLDKHEVLALALGGGDDDDQPASLSSQLTKGGAEVENVGESGEESEDEWNYYRVEPTGDKEAVGGPQEPDSGALDEMESQLNPNAAVFIPSSPTEDSNHIEQPFNENLTQEEFFNKGNVMSSSFIAHEPITTPQKMDLEAISAKDEVWLSSSPKRGGVPLDNVEVPSEDEFDLELSQRPGDLDVDHQFDTMNQQDVDIRGIQNGEKSLEDERGEEEKGPTPSSGGALNPFEVPPSVEAPNEEERGEEERGPTPSGGGALNPFEVPPSVEAPEVCEDENADGELFVPQIVKEEVEEMITESGTESNACPAMEDNLSETSEQEFSKVAHPPEDSDAMNADLLGGFGEVNRGQDVPEIVFHYDHSPIVSSASGFNEMELNCQSQESASYPDPLYISNLSSGLMNDGFIQSSNTFDAAMNGSSTSNEFFTSHTKIPAQSTPLENELFEYESAGINAGYDKQAVEPTELGVPSQFCHQTEVEVHAPYEQEPDESVAHSDVKSELNQSFMEDSVHSESMKIIPEGGDEIVQDELADRLVKTHESEEEIVHEPAPNPSSETEEKQDLNDQPAFAPSAPEIEFSTSPILEEPHNEEQISSISTTVASKLEPVDDLQSCPMDPPQIHNVESDIAAGTSPDFNSDAQLAAPVSVAAVPDLCDVPATEESASPSDVFVAPDVPPVDEDPSNAPEDSLPAPDLVPCMSLPPNVDNCTDLVSQVDTHVESPAAEPPTDAQLEDTKPVEESCVAERVAPTATEPSIETEAEAASVSAAAAATVVAAAGLAAAAAAATGGESKVDKKPTSKSTVSKAKPTAPAKAPLKTATKPSTASSNVTQRKLGATSTAAAPVPAARAAPRAAPPPRPKPAEGASKPTSAPTSAKPAAPRTRTTAPVPKQPADKKPLTNGDAAAKAAAPKPLSRTTTRPATAPARASKPAPVGSAAAPAATAKPSSAAPPARPPATRPVRAVPPASKPKPAAAAPSAAAAAPPAPRPRPASAASLPARSAAASSKPTKETVSKVTSSKPTVPRTAAAASKAPSSKPASASSASIRSVPVKILPAKKPAASTGTSKAVGVKKPSNKTEAPLTNGVVKNGHAAPEEIAVQNGVSHVEQIVGNGELH